MPFRWRSQNNYFFICTIYINILDLYSCQRLKFLQLICDFLTCVICDILTNNFTRIAYTN